MSGKWSWNLYWSTCLNLWMGISTHEVCNIWLMLTIKCCIFILSNCIHWQRNTVIIYSTSAERWVFILWVLHGLCDYEFKVQSTMRYTCIMFYLTIICMKFLCIKQWQFCKHCETILLFSQSINQNRIIFLAEVHSSGSSSMREVDEVGWQVS